MKSAALFLSSRYFFSFFLDIILSVGPISFKSCGCVGSLGSDIVIVICWNSEYGCGWAFTISIYSPPMGGESSLFIGCDFSFTV